jgi:hypothetical protein
LFQVELSYLDGSPANGVTVQVKAELTPKDNVYTSGSVSQGGLVQFEIPSIPTLAQHVWLEVSECPGSLSLGRQVGTWCCPEGDHTTAVEVLDSGTDIPAIQGRREAKEKGR